MPDQYAGIVIRINGWDEARGAWPVEANLDDGSSYLGGVLRLDRQALLSVHANPEQYGTQIFNALFDGPIREAYNVARGRAGGRVRVRLRIEPNAAELHAYAWERLFDPEHGAWGTGLSTPFSRYTALPRAEPAPVEGHPIRLLVAIANPTGLPGGLGAINVDQEVAQLYSALADLPRGNMVRVRLLPGHTGLSSHLRQQLEDNGYEIQQGPTSLDNIVRSLTECHILHLLSHGYFQRAEEYGPGTASLFLEGTDGAVQPEKDTTVAGKLGKLVPPLQLVFLAACESAKGDPTAEHPFVGLGPRLVEQGIPAVVAMQDRVRMEAARQLTADFYQDLLLRHGMIDLALNRSRLLLFNQQAGDWAIPVLFMRHPQGQLFVPESAQLSKWLARHRQRLEDQFAKHMRGGENITPQQSTERYVDLLVREQPKSSSDQTHESTPLGAPLATFAVESGARILLLGEGGSGKSTALLKLSADVARTVLEPTTQIPIYVRLNEFDTKEQGFDRLLTMLSNAAGLDERDLKALWRTGNRPLLLLLDGFNEVGEEFQAACTAALQSLMQVPGHAYVITSRPGTAAERLVIQIGQITTLEILQFDNSQIREFLVDHGAALLYDRMGDTLMGLARNPFMLWALVQSCAGLPEGELPRNRGQLYKNFIDRYVFGEREAQKVPAPAEYNYGLVKKPLLSKLALAMTQQGLTRVKQDLELLKTLRDQLKEIRSEYEGLIEIKSYDVMPDPPAAQGFLDELIDNGVLRRVGDSLEFMHQSVQDYFTGVAISSWTTQEIFAQTRPLVWRHVDVSSRRIGAGTRDLFFEPIIMHVGLSAKAAELLQALQQHNPLLAAHCLAAATNVPADVQKQLRHSWLAMLDRRHERYRAVACQCFAAALLNDAEIADRLVAVVLQDEETWVRWEAVRTLTRIQSDESVRQLVKVSLQDLDDERARGWPENQKWNWAARALFDINSPVAVKLLFDAWRRTDMGEKYQRRAEILLGYLNPNLVSQQLESIMRKAKISGAAATCSAAAEALGHLRNWQEDAHDFMGMITASQARSRSNEVILKMDETRRQPIQVLIESLRHEWAGVRRAAASELGERKTREAIPALLEALWSETERNIVATIMIALAQLGSDPQITQALNSRMDSIDSNVRARAAATFAFCGDTQVAPVLTRLLQANDATVRAYAAMGLGEIGSEEASRALADTLSRETDEEPLEEIIVALGKVRTETSIETLMDVMVHPERRSDWPWAASSKSRTQFEDWTDLVHGSLEKLGAKSRVVASLEESLQSGNSMERARAVRELARWAATTQELVHLQEKALHDPDATVRASVIEGLRRYGDGAQFPELLQLALQDSYAEIRARAVELLGASSTGEPHARALLNQALQDPEAQVRDAAIKVLSTKQDEQTQELLLKLAFSDPDSLLRESAARTLRWFDGNGFVIHLIETLGGPDSTQRARAADALGFIGDELAIEPLLRSLTDEESQVRAAAAAALIGLKDEAVAEPAIRTLVEIAKQDTDTDIRRMASRVLNTIPHGLEAVLPGGLDGLHDAVGRAYDLGNYTEVIKLVDQWLPVFPDDVFLHLLHSIAYGEQKDFEQALTSARNSVELVGDNVVLQTQLGWYAYKTGHLEESITASQRALELDPKEVTAAFNLGLALFASGSVEAARNAYMQAVQIATARERGTTRTYLDAATHDLEELQQSSPDLYEPIEEVKLILHTKRNALRDDDSLSIKS